jgi:hypothetical protein
VILRRYVCLSSSIQGHHHRLDWQPNREEHIDQGNFFRSSRCATNNPSCTYTPNITSLALALGFLDLWTTAGIHSSRIPTRPLT